MIGTQGFVENAIASADLRIVFVVIVVDGHVGIEVDLEVCDFWIVDVVLIDFFGNDEESHVIFFLQHYFHLIQDELQLLPLVHGTVCFDLHFLQNGGSFHDVVVVFFPLHDHHDAASVLDLNIVAGTSRKIFLAQTSRMVSIRRVRWGSEM